MSKTLIFNRIEQFCVQQGLFSEGQKILLGLSGGPDSVFLLYFFVHLQKKYTLKILAAHVDHGWRPESARDTQFCQELCAQLDIPYYHTHLSSITPLKKASGSAEQDARNARRAFFERLAHEHRADAIALAHHHDDLLETFFIRLIRGSGLTGLTSIKPAHEGYIRPLLEISKIEIVEHLHEQGIPYCVDHTNQDLTLLRNKIRHTLMPAYSALDARAADNLVRTIEQLQQADRFIERTAQSQYSGMVHDDWLDCVNFFTVDAVVQHRILLAWLIEAGVPFTPSEKFFAEIIRFLQQPASKKHQLTSTWSIEKVKRKARIIRTPRERSSVS